MTETLCSLRSSIATGLPPGGSSATRHGNGEGASSARLSPWRLTCGCPGPVQALSAPGASNSGDSRAVLCTTGESASGDSGAIFSFQQQFATAPSQPAPAKPAASPPTPKAATEPVATQPALAAGHNHGRSRNSSHGCGHNDSHHSSNRCVLRSNSRGRPLPPPPPLPPPSGRAANRCVLSEIARRAESLACVVLRALDEPDMTAWLVELVRQDLTTSKSIQEKHCQWQNRLRSLWLALPRDTRPPATGGREAHATCISVCQHDLTTREGQAADLFKDLFNKTQVRWWR